jgi:uncharacterized protein (TIGR02284 family)
MNNEVMGNTPNNTATSNDDVISALNNLIETCKDGQQGFAESAEGVSSSDLKKTFYELGQQRVKFVGELQALVRELGGDPESSGSVVGAIHRGWINIKSAIMGKDEEAILNEAERGEDVAKKYYEDAVAMNLPSNVMSVVREQYSAVKEAHDKVRSLRNSAGGTSSSANM